MNHEGFMALRERVRMAYPTCRYVNGDFVHEENGACVRFSIHPHGGRDRELEVRIRIDDESFFVPVYHYSDVWFEAWCEHHRFIGNACFDALTVAISSVRGNELEILAWHAELGVYNWAQRIRRGFIPERLDSLHRSEDFWAEAFRYITAPFKQNNDEDPFEQIHNRDRHRPLRAVLCQELAILRGYSKEESQENLARIQRSGSVADALI